ncbi:competence protein [Fredinandcohnia quinoae]|uniref:Competence protein n=1 Tax=Fredinandcohnia quinoae TaxID=2918902 RepID=A0AAW5DYX1_9BACI|nr:competence protein [Fredinandcohnia sp. SECRCQ15]MCH1625846.1 competence protein [Fredinandcohnia sp. SECRCQ15]
MGSNKSKRFVHQGADAVQQHAQRFPYRSTLAEAEEKKMKNVEKSSLGGV